MKVLVTNPGYRNTLAITRALGRQGVSVQILGFLNRRGEEQDGAAFHSRFCSGKFFSRDPRHDFDGFIDDLEQILAKNRFDAFLPVSTNTVIPVSKHEDRIRKFAPFPFPDYTKVEKAHNKMKTLSLARDAGIPIPLTIPTDPRDQIEERVKELVFPVVIKTCKGANSSGVFYAHNLQEIYTILDRLEQEPHTDRSAELTNSHESMIQEYIGGQIFDVCALCKQGNILVHTLQVRERTFPVNGGSGMINKTCDHEEILEYARQLVFLFEWDGICMIEFKLDEDSNPRLMELNPKFWGTLDLSIRSGVNFPYLACLFALKQDIPQIDYQRDLRYRWIIPDGIRTILASDDKFAAAYDFLWPFRRRIVSDFWFSDLSPTIFSVRKALR